MSKDDSHLVEQLLATEAVFEGKLLRVFRDTVRLPSGSAALREVIRHPGAVVIIGVLDNGRLLFERQYRHAVGRVMIELPAGKLDGPEDPLDCARRELREETGYEAGHWQYLGVMHPCIGYSDERIEIFLARELQHVGCEPDEAEPLDILELSMKDALSAVFDGAITDSKTLSALLWAQRVLHDLS
ncbi:MAG: NUDIX hydrolase [Betaproteobacteria bacterium]|nr:NUDIX hydrolase [Betaproteobacteria bacterium]